MELSRISEYFDDTDLDVLRSSDSVWQHKRITGQIKISDDFISIFNRPTRRRMLLLSETQYNNLNGNVIRVTGSDTVYLIGNPQKDYGKGGVYRVTIPLNKAQSLVEVFRKNVTGPSNDPGALVRTSLGNFYMDLELRTLSQEGEGLNSTFSKYFFWFDNDTTFTEGDEFDYDNKTFRIVESYMDTGFRGIRATTETDARETLTYRKQSGPTVQNPATGRYVTPYSDTTFSAEILEKIESRPNSGGVSEVVIYTVLVEQDHLGVTPSTRDKVIIDGSDRDIVKIVKNRRDKSWELTCQ